MREAPKPTLELIGVSGGYGKRMSQPVLREVNLALMPGELVALTGPNGAGKTSLFRAMLHLLPWQIGTVLLNGEELGSPSANTRARTQIGYVPQTHGKGAFPITVRDAILLGRWGSSFAWLRRPGKEDRRITEEMAEAVGLEPLLETDCRSLSGGQQQRLHMARALVRQPKLLLLDEPSTYLDDNSRSSTMELVRELRNCFHFAALMISHDGALVENWADRVLRLEGGRLV